MTTARYHPDFEKELRKYSSIRKSVKTKIGNLFASPMEFGEPLKGDLRGLSSCPVKKNFILIYVYCKECRAKSHQNIHNCPECDETPDETVTFLAIGPHDAAYKAAKKRIIHF